MEGPGSGDLSSNNLLLMGETDCSASFGSRGGTVCTQVHAVGEFSRFGTLLLLLSSHYYYIPIALSSLCVPERAPAADPEGVCEEPRAKQRDRTGIHRQRSTLSIWVDGCCTTIFLATTNLPVQRTNKEATRYSSAMPFTMS